MVRTEAAKITVEALKEAGVNFVAILPDPPHTELQKVVQADKSFKLFHISTEGIGFAACAGAWHGGMRPAFITTTAGLHNMCWAISAYRNRLSPVLILMEYRGDAGDRVWFMRKYIHKIEQYLELFGAPYKVVNKVEEIRPAITRMATTCFYLFTPGAILLSGDTVW